MPQGACFSTRLFCLLSSGVELIEYYTSSVVVPFYILRLRCVLTICGWLISPSSYSIVRPLNVIRIIRVFNVYLNRKPLFVVSGAMDITWHRSIQYNFKSAHGRGESGVVDVEPSSARAAFDDLCV